MPVQPPAGAFKASVWLPTARIRFSSPRTPSSLPYASHAKYSAAMPSSSSANPASEPRRGSIDQTWRPPNGIVFGSSPSNQTTRTRSSPSIPTVPLARSISPEPHPAGGQPLRRVHTEADNGISKPLSPDEAPRTRSTRTRKPRVSSPRSISNCATSDALVGTTGGEPTFRDMLESRRSGPVEPETAAAYQPHGRAGLSMERRLNMAPVYYVLEEVEREEQRETPTKVTTVPRLTHSHSVPDGVLQAARDAGQYWQYGLYRGPDGRKPTLHYCRKREASEYVAQQFLDDGATLLGFDLEWKVHHARGRGPGSIKDNVSVIQLASESRVALFHIALHRGTTAEELLAPALRAILESAAIVKVGVNINGDCTRLAGALGVDVRARFELSHAHKLVAYSQHDPHKVNRKLVALDKLVEEHLGLPMFKGEVRTGTWDRELDMEQLKYAASDAYAGLQLFGVLDAKRRAMKPTPPLPLPAESRLPIRLAAACDDVEDNESWNGPSMEEGGPDEDYVDDVGPSRRAGPFSKA